MCNGIWKHRLWLILVELRGTKWENEVSVFLQLRLSYIFYYRLLIINMYRFALSQVWNNQGCKYFPQQRAHILYMNPPSLMCTKSMATFPHIYAVKLLTACALNYTIPSLWTLFLTLSVMLSTACVPYDSNSMGSSIHTSCYVVYCACSKMQFCSETSVVCEKVTYWCNTLHVGSLHPGTHFCKL